MAAALGPGDWVPYSGSSTAGDEGWTDHSWPGRSWLVGPHFVRTSADPDVIAAEVARLDWLRPRLGCPEPEIVDDGWLVLAMPAAAPAHRPEAHPEPDLLPAALGRSLRRLHDLDPGGCPFSRDWATIVQQLALAVDAGLVEPERLDEPYRRYAPDRLLELVDETRPPAVENCVVHGSPVLSNLFAVDGEPGPVTGCHRLGVGDRHVDLAIVTRQIQSTFGPDAVFGFYEGYGDDPDLVRLDHYILLDAIDAAIVDGSRRP